MCVLYLTICTGITLIEVPYWWDKTVESLSATIYNARPDLFDSKPQGSPIPSNPLTINPAVNYQIETRNPSKNVLMTATQWDKNRDPTGWYMTEKYDGMRFYWDGTHCYSRQGNQIKLPISLSSKLPSVALDGELWYALKFYTLSNLLKILKRTQYGLYQEPAALIHSSNEEKWSKAVFWIFDAPDLTQTLEVVIFIKYNLPKYLGAN